MNSSQPPLAFSPELPLLLTASGSYSYALISSWIQATAQQITQQQIPPSSIVALYGSTSLPYILLEFAFIRAGFTVLPLNTYLPPDRLFSLLQEVSCTFLCGESLSRSLGKGKDITFFAFEELLAPLPTSSSFSQKCPLAEWRSPSLMQQEQAVTLLFTSGSSGTPKAVLHTLGNHYFNALGANLNLPFQPQDRWLLSLPLYHVGGFAILIRAFLGGASVVLPERGSSLLENLERFALTHLSLVSTQIYQLLKEPRALPYLRALKGVLLGGSVLEPSLIEEALDQGIPILPTYGSTETASQCCTLPLNAPRPQFLTAGKVLPYREVCLGTHDEIWIRGPVLFKGYLRQGKLYSGLNEEGWYPSRDRGEWDDKGYLRIKGRLDHQFISGGENIQPEEIEYFLMQHPKIEWAVVVPREDPKYGKRPLAFLKVQASFAWESVEEFRKELRSVLAPYQIPLGFYPLPQDYICGGKGDRLRLERLAHELQVHSSRSALE
jgi:O-succinylbenzoic acid--CoA ligase